MRTVAELIDTPDPAWPDLAAGPGPQTVLVGHDVLGGRFELTGPDPVAARRPGEPGQICYFAPDTLEWECLGIGYGVWLSWIAAGRTSEFYASLRWPGWEAESSALRLSQGISVIPFLWSSEARQDLATTSRAPVPIEEMFGLQAEMARTLAGLPNGTMVQVRVVNPGEDQG